MRILRANTRERVAVSLLFTIMGLTLGSWASRVPDIQSALRLSNAEWGLTGTVAMVGDIISLGLITIVVGRSSIRRLSLLGAVFLLLAAPVAAAAPSLTIFVFALFAWGFAGNLMATPMNAQAVLVDRQYHRPILVGFHACYSIGMLAGGLLSIGAVAAGLSAGWQLSLTSGALASLLIGTHRWLPDETARSERRERHVGPARRSLRDRLSRRLVLLAGIGFLAALTESAVRYWSAIYTSDTLSAGRMLGAMTFTCLATADAVSRLGGDRLVAWVGPLRFLQLSMLLAAGGLGCALAVGTPIAALVGFTVVGLGVGCAVPTVIGLAGNDPDVSAAEGISTVALGQWPAFLVAPPLIGVLAGYVGLRAALVTLIISAVLVSLLAARVERRNTIPMVEVGAIGVRVRFFHRAVRGRRRGGRRAVRSPRSGAGRSGAGR